MRCLRGIGQATCKRLNQPCHVGQAEQRRQAQSIGQGIVGNEARPTNGKDNGIRLASPPARPCSV